MFRKYLITLVILLISVLCHAQSGRERAALKDLTKHRWGKALSALRKSIRKDSLNVPAYYVLANYYFNAQNPDFQLDSAYAYTLRATNLWNEADSRSRARWSKFPLDSQRLGGFREEIDSAAFLAAKSRNTEEAWNHFIDHYPLARQQQTAISLRNAVAFQKAVSENTYKAYQLFIEKYPEAQQISQAKHNYELLLYEYYTRDQRLESFLKFIEDYPQSPYRDRAEKSVFHLMTAAGTPDAMLAFVTAHPTSRYVRTATDLLYHILAEDSQEKLFPSHLASDSISALAGLDREYLVPFFVKGKFGFMNSSGKEIIPARFSDIGDEYLCGNINEDVLVLTDRIVDRNGKTIWTGRNVSSVTDLGYGFLKVESDKGIFPLHKSGFLPVDFFIQDARILNGRMLAFQVNDKWGIYSFAGRKLISADYDEISTFGNVVVLRRGETFRLVSLQAIGLGTPVTPDALAGPYDEVKRSGENIVFRKGDEHGIVNQNLRLLVAPERQVITPAFFGSVVQSPTGYSTVNANGEQSEHFTKLEVREPWVAAKTTEGWVLYDPSNRMYKSVPYDTVQTFGPFAVGETADGVEINLLRKPNFNLNMRKPDRIESLSGPDSLSFLLVEAEKKLNVYDQEGNSMFSGSYDRIQYAGKGFFVVVRKEKKGLVNTSGKVILPMEYDAIGTASNGTISLLKGMKFGLYDIGKQKLIKPAFDKNIWRYNPNLYVAFKGTGLGFVDDTGKALGGFDFSEIHPWKDSVALVKQGTVYHLYDLYAKKTILSDVTAYKVIRDAPEEKLFIFTQKDQSGVISNQRGVIIPINFSDIVNVGSPEHAMYFTEKHVKEASIFVVIYYDHDGKMLRREVYEQDEYDRIYCDD